MNSHLGGSPALPADQAWPRAEGRSLSFLASIDLAEVPAADGRDLLPVDGTLLFFGDLENAVREDRSRVIHLPAGAQPQTVDIYDRFEELQALLDGSAERVIGRVLGNPLWALEDPRRPGDVLLMQVDSSPETGMSLGDGGSFYFFARPADLRAGRFDEVFVTDWTN